MIDQLIGDAHVDKKPETILEKIEILKSFFSFKSDRIFILGDVFDNRNHINTIAVKLLQQLLESVKVPICIILGNHDMRFKNVSSPNSLEVAFKNISNVTIIDKPTIIDDYLLVPYIHDKNYNECIEAIKSSDRKYCIGHFDIQNFEIVKGKSSYDGLKMSLFRSFKKVFSGHFHLRQEQSNILYVGSICQNTWTDFNNQKGFYSIENDDIIFHEGPKQIYKHLILETDKDDFELIDYEDCHIKVFHNEKLSNKQFKKIEELKLKVRSYKIFDETNVLIEAQIDKVEFSDMLHEYMQQQDINDELKTKIIDYLLMVNEEIG